ncbi:MAG: hypothetical protein WDA27_15380 [Actinomycetota bacterium]
MKTTIKSECGGCGNVTTARSGYCPKCQAERRTLRVLADKCEWDVSFDGNRWAVKNSFGYIMGDGVTSLEALRQAAKV